LWSETAHAGPETLILEQHWIDLLTQAIARCGLGRDLQGWKVLGHRSLPLGQFVIPAVQTQTQREAHRPPAIEACDRVVGQGIGAVTVVVVPVYRVKEAPHMLTERISNNYERLAAALAMGRGLSEHEADAATIDRVLPPGGLREQARQVRWPRIWPSPRVTG
jgi:hypothetical protein